MLIVKVGAPCLASAEPGALRICTSASVILGLSSSMRALLRSVNRGLRLLCVICRFFFPFIHSSLFVSSIWFFLFIPLFVNDLVSCVSFVGCGKPRLHLHLRKCKVCVYPPSPKHKISNLIGCPSRPIMCCPQQKSTKQKNLV